ncbi:hypothetical protein NTGM5_290083 [Candidatus Nitrotoga sp. M5]|nr:hypothetical protein NTGM5_290083 [Candidatus Nitrotoga sp. M5]
MASTFTALRTYTQTCTQIPHTARTLAHSFTDGGISYSLANTNIHSSGLYLMQLSLFLSRNKILLDAERRVLVKLTYG